MSERAASRRDSRHLPPIELRADDYKDPLSPEFLKHPTPLNEIGLVDKTRLIKLVRGTLTSAYHWPSEMDDEHHLQWPKRLYENQPAATVNPYEFRNLPINKTYLPRTFHNWVHRITEPPPLPSEEVMHYTSQAQIAIDSLYRSVQIAKMLTRNKEIPLNSRNNRVNELFDEYSVILEEMQQLPREFHFIDTERYAVDSVEEFLAHDGELGRLATVPTVATSTRYIRQSTYKSTTTSAA